MATENKARDRRCLESIRVIDDTIKNLLAERTALEKKMNEVIPRPWEEESK